MSVLHNAANIAINNSVFNAISNTGTTSIVPQTDIVSLLLSHSATAGLLDAAERFDAPKCDEGTRVSMLQGMKDFVHQGGPSSSPALYWLHGPAGVGKSALAQSLALSLKDTGDHAASFFFSRTSPGRNDGNQLIVTLAYQLAIALPALQPFLSETIKRNPAILAASNTVKMQSLIIDPINGWQKKHRRSLRWWTRKVFRTGQEFHPRLILVDGLDECNDPRVQRDIILSIGLAVKKLSLPFRFVVASRPESHILSTFELDPIFQPPRGVGLVSKNLGEDDGAGEQITTFLLKEFAEIRRTHPIREFLPQPWPAPGQISQLVSKSSKGFIYPATVIRYIRMPTNRPDECLDRILGISEIPVHDKPYEALDELYRYIFASIPDENKKDVHDIFQFLVIPTNLEDLLDITPHLIEGHYGYKPGRVQHVLRDLLCIVAVTSQHEPLRVLHASLPDFLLDSSRSGSLSIDDGAAHATIAALFPRALCTIDCTGFFPDSRFAPFLEHLMQANIVPGSLAFDKLSNVDFRSRYAAPASVYLGKPDLTAIFIDGASFVTAFLLGLVIQNVNVNGYVADIRADIVRRSPLASLVHLANVELVPAMTVPFYQWISEQHEYINRMLEDVDPSVYEARDEVFELYLLMVITTLEAPDRNSGISSHFEGNHYRQQLSISSARISHVLLGFLLHDYPGNKRNDDLLFLAVGILGASLQHTDYSVAIIDLLDNLQSTSLPQGKRVRAWLPPLAPIVTDYLTRVASGVPDSTSHQAKVKQLHEIWSQYLHL